MNMDDSRLIARFQRLTTELLIEKRLGQRRPELTDELYQTWLEVDQRGLKETPVPKRPVERRSARFVARRIGETQQPRCCASPLFKRNRARRHAQRFPRGGVTPTIRIAACHAWPIDSTPAASDYDLESIAPQVMEPRPLDGAIVQSPQRIKNNCDINHFLEDGALHGRDQAERRRDHPED